VNFFSERMPNIEQSDKVIQFDVHTTKTELMVIKSMSQKNDLS